MKMVVVEAVNESASRQCGLAVGAVELVQFVADNPEDARLLEKLREQIDPARVEISLALLLVKAEAGFKNMVDAPRRKA